MNDTWRTPLSVFDPLNKVFHFENDAAADTTNHLCPLWYGPGGIYEDALVQSWEIKSHWCNPPYSRGLQRPFVERAIECAEGGGVVVLLLPADTSTKLFHYIWNHKLCHVSFREGRIKFVGAPGPAKFGSMIVEVRK